MSEVATPLVPVAHAPSRGAEVEDQVIGDEIVRHGFSARAGHWVMAVGFLGALFSGLPIFWPVFGWLAPLFGGLAVCRWIHPWFGLVFAAGSLWTIALWARDMVLSATDREFLSPAGLQKYLSFESHDPNVGRYNGGQKAFYHLGNWSMVLLLASGVVLWFPGEFGAMLRIASWLVHDVAFGVMTIALVSHVYLGTIAEPGTFMSIVRGRVTKAWARTHHPKWYAEVMKKAGK